MLHLVQDVDSGGGCESMRQGSIWVLSILLAQFCYEHGIALKNNIYSLKSKS